MKNIIKSSNLNELGNKLINVILNRKNVFDNFSIVFPNNKMEQWFKTYWLKNRSEILMNVNFSSLNDIILKLLQNEKHLRLMKKDDLKKYIIKHLAKQETLEILPNHIKEFFYINGELNPIKLYDLANELASLYMDYEQETFNFNGFEKQLYKKVLEDAYEEGYSTLGYLFENRIGVKKSNQILYLFGFNSINKLQEKIIDEYSKNSDINLYCLENTNNEYKDYSLTLAPSKLREIEYVHTTICELLKDNENKYSDFLVLAPNISDYESIITRVFKQDNINFPNIPFTINDKKKVNSNVSTGILKLFDIANKKFFTRLDFFELINNQDIQLSRGITQEDVFEWSTSLIKMNVFRNSKNFDDWEYAKKRVLLSKITNIGDYDESVIELSNSQYIPFSTIGLNDESIVRFVKIIDDIKSWLDFINNTKFVSNESLNQIENELDKWFSNLDINGFETNKYYISVVNEINKWKVLKIDDNVIPLHTLLFSLIDASKITHYKGGNLFTRGITFADFDLDSIVACKHVFFLNAGSKEIPNIKVKSELDQRDYDISNLDKVKDAFFLQYNNSNNFYLSYINKNLSSDEDLYPSSLVLDLMNKKTVQQKVISLDETRSWDKLYTKREYKNKDYFGGLLSLKEENKTENINISHEMFKKVKLGDMSKYLEGPFRFKANNLFGRTSDLHEKILDEYEPFSLSKLDGYKLIKSITLDYLVNGNIENLNEHYQKIIEKLNLERKLPIINEYVNFCSFNGLMKEHIKIVSLILYFTGDKLEVLKLQDLVFNTNGNQWVLTCDQEICRSVHQNGRTYLQIKKIKGEKAKLRDNLKEFLFLYVASLMDVASLNTENEETVWLVRNNAYLNIRFSITSSRAKELLINIYNAMNDYSNNYVVLFEKLIKDPLLHLDALVSSIDSPYGDWGHYEDKKMFDVETQTGYEYEGFDKKYQEVKMKHIDLLEFIKPLLLEEEDKDNGEI